MKAHVACSYNCLFRNDKDFSRSNTVTLQIKIMVEFGKRYKMNSLLLGCRPILEI